MKKLIVGRQGRCNTSRPVPRPTRPGSLSRSARCRYRRRSSWVAADRDDAVKLPRHPNARDRIAGVGRRAGEHTVEHGQRLPDARSVRIDAVFADPILMQAARLAAR